MDGKERSFNLGGFYLLFFLFGRNYRHSLLEMGRTILAYLGLELDTTNH